MNDIIYLLLLLLMGFSKSVNGQSEVQWKEFASVQQMDHSKLIFVELYTNWCKMCQQMEQNTYSNPHVSEYLNSHFIPVKFDAEYTEEIIFKNEKYSLEKIDGKGIHGLVKELTMGNIAFPTVVILDTDFNIIQPIQGYKSSDEMLCILKYFEEGFYQKMPWKSYAATKCVNE